MHLGNLRTAMLAWLFAKSTGRDFLIRIEDLDQARSRDGLHLLEDLAAVGITWDAPVVAQSERLQRYGAALDSLSERGLTYECFCSRKDIAQAASAPHAIPGHYPGTCRNLSAAERAARRRTRQPALRLRAGVDRFTVTELLRGKPGAAPQEAPAPTFTGEVDDFVLQRADGTFAYNLAVVVDDAAQDVDQVVRGDDLLSSAPRQAYLATLLGLPVPSYAHVPLVLNGSGARLAKRDGAVTLADLRERGVDANRVTRTLLGSLGLGGAQEGRNLAAALTEFDAAALPREPWVWAPGAFEDTRG